MKKAIIMAVLISLVMTLIYGVSVTCILEHDRDYCKTVNHIVTMRKMEADGYRAEMNEKIFLSKLELERKIIVEEGREGVLEKREISRYYDTKNVVYEVSFENGHKEWYIINYETNEIKFFSYTG